MHGVKSAILPKLKNCQNGTFELVHGIQNFFWAGRLLLKRYKNNVYKKYPYHVPPNLGFQSVRVEN